jgi:hypothetical protein
MIPSPFKITATRRSKYARREAQTGEFGNLISKDIMDATKVVRVAPECGFGGRPSRHR